jgi:hypothetical protein
VTAHWLRHTTLKWVERGFGQAVARAYAGHAETSGSETGATSIYTKAPLEEVAAALSALTGEPHPLAEPNADDPVTTRASEALNAPNCPAANPHLRWRARPAGHGEHELRPTRPVCPPARSGDCRGRNPAGRGSDAATVPATDRVANRDPFRRPDRATLARIFHVGLLGDGGRSGSVVERVIVPVGRDSSAEVARCAGSTSRTTHRQRQPPPRPLAGQRLIEPDGARCRSSGSRRPATRPAPRRCPLVGADSTHYGCSPEGCSLLAADLGLRQATSSLLRSTPQLSGMPTGTVPA